jgi:hypothetical protein
VSSPPFRRRGPPSAPHVIRVRFKLPSSRPVSCWRPRWNPPLTVDWPTESRATQAAPFTVFGRASSCFCCLIGHQPYYLIKLPASPPRQTDLLLLPIQTLHRWLASRAFLYGFTYSFFIFIFILSVEFEGPAVGICIISGVNMGESRWVF